MIKIICLGKLKEQYLIDMINDYSKRINKYHKLEVCELKDTEDLLKESIDIKKHIPNNSYIITLEINGNIIDSENLSRIIDKTFINYPNIVFIIGSSNGLHDNIKQISNYQLSFSKMTFPHGLFRGILLEQIYRSFKIINNENYHK